MHINKAQIITVQFHNIRHTITGLLLVYSTRSPVLSNTEYIIFDAPDDFEGYNDFQTSPSNVWLMVTGTSPRIRGRLEALILKKINGQLDTFSRVGVCRIWKHKFSYHSLIENAEFQMGTIIRRLFTYNLLLN
jgi:hypothetical protein